MKEIMPMNVVCQGEIMTTLFKTLLFLLLLILYVFVYFLQDDFNLTGLNVLVPYYDYALDMVLDVEMPMEDSLTEEQQEIVESAAVRLVISCAP